ncbi:alkylation response protein AidB-like acyl-CoA dehydrogenase [Mycolicibacterium sp. BK556]|uniref:acyl-CoA dehydrogenase family protein n=1 Tax=Mycobacteriaceae TaxID=1762 RepID=UPI00105FE137|nr:MULTISPECIES: acyl-CoA dehydrogenase family protein [Mycobacteriaceae]MBB3600384.1 alkylation response protein AidB-like acyl-CoA dehydrogenase [Mycolicibacterium sp. BK556]MBB3630136.1 alkylation response protein AidB-like acyl-CoA dehydrogenase [Mycolicibacterium sp. BK607]MBB3748134.1 alkylation response protein AidB-like acyl-CoA dehydrogenase [Mycolicibacterium sp. BK634]TDO09951.1 alkylation response protein AidB-like acyl-CoA dehydrogenase [Mycobacterium sp. BK086]
MTTPVLEKLLSNADQIRIDAQEAERLCMLTPRTAALLRDVGMIKMLQPKRYGGQEATPREFAETVMGLAALDPAAGWVSGVVGVHPWQLGFADPAVRQEIWGEDDNTWVASPYAPQGVAVPVDGGYRLSGRWQFSSGTDFCRWVILGAMLGDYDGKPQMPPTMLHVILPRSDYEIVADSWDTVGLRGTGSKDLIVREAFVPNHRVMNGDHVLNGQAQIDAGCQETLYRLPWSHVFPLGITSAIIGAAEGALSAHLEYQRSRSDAMGAAVRDDPIVLYAIGEASADIDAARNELLANADRMWNLVASGDTPTFEQRALGRRTQVRAAWRAVGAVDALFARSGGNAIRHGGTVQRYWRDVHAGLNHVIHVPNTVYQAATLVQLGIDPPPKMKFMI